MINKKFIYIIIQSMRCLSKAESDIRKDLNRMSFSKDINYIKSGFREGFSKNFFTLFMISLMINAKVDYKKIVSYTKIIVYLRSIITAIDNIIDNDNKGVLFFGKIEEPVSRNSFLTLQMQNLLNKELMKVCPNDVEHVANKIMEALYQIASAESLRDVKNYKDYPNYDYIFNNINTGIGGDLLKIGLLAPFILENNKEINISVNALYLMGLQLQSLDDLCDIEEDYNDGKINLAMSYFMDKLNLTQEQVISEDILKTEAVNDYLLSVINKTLEAFRLLEEINFPLDKKDAIRLLEELFKLRGLKKYWNKII